MALQLLLERLIRAAAEGAARGIARAIIGKLEESDDITPMTHAANEHNRRQMDSAIAAAKADNARRQAITTRPPKPPRVTLPERGGSHGSTEGQGSGSGEE
jgi:hypothetical protein